MAKNNLTVIIDRPIGYDHDGTIYPINYGYVAGIMGGDGEEQDAYILTEGDQPLKTFTGQLIAVVHRADDVETKWIVADSDTHIPLEELWRQFNSWSNTLSQRLK